MTGHRIIRNPDGSAYVVDHEGRHVKTHDTAAEAKEHLEELRERYAPAHKSHSEDALKGHKHFSPTKQMEKAQDRRPDKLSHDPYYKHPGKNKP